MSLSPHKGNNLPIAPYYEGILDTPMASQIFQAPASMKPIGPNYNNNISPTLISLK